LAAAKRERERDIKRAMKEASTDAAADATYSWLARKEGRRVDKK
jgi:hypothetical protein